MSFDLTIEELELSGISVHARERLNQEIEQELERLMATRGSAGVDSIGEIEVDQVDIDVAPGASLSEIATSIAEKLLSGLDR